MDPLTGYVTIVGLLCNFRQERGAREDLEHRQFIEWLATHKHEDLKNLIINQAALQTEIDNLLQQDMQTMSRKLEDISKILFSILARLDGFRGLAAAASAPESELTPQAISILVQFVNSGGDLLIYDDLGGGRFVFQIQNCKGEGFIGVTEPRFIPDDLKTLMGFRLLDIEENSQGMWMCRLTRNGQRFYDLLNDEVKVTPTPTLPR